MIQNQDEDIPKSTYLPQSTYHNERNMKETQESLQLGKNVTSYMLRFPTCPLLF
jgi:hypothetical protein